jgi:hypothetical protein
MLYAARLAAGYAPELHLAGVAAAAPGDARFAGQVLRRPDGIEHRLPSLAPTR